MAAKSFARRISLGIASGVLGGFLCLIIAYSVGVIVIAITLRELGATLLAAATVLPLMLLFVGLPVTIVLGVVIGGLLGICASLRNQAAGPLVGAFIGSVSAVVILSLLLPLIVPPQHGDFIHIVSNPYLSTGYGLVLGVVARWLLRWMDT